MEAEKTPDKSNQDDVVAIELPAPSGWTKKVALALFFIISCALI